MKMYKYLLVCDRNKELIYAECIEWKLSEFDRKNKDFIKGRLKKKHLYYILSDDKKSHTIDGNTVSFDLNENNLTFKFSEKFKDTIYLTDDEELYNPLIDHCSDIDIFIGDEENEFSSLDWIKENRPLIEDIDKRFGVNLERNQELKGSFSIYNPIRLLIKSRFTDKPNKNEDRLPKSLEVTILDEFDTHGDLFSKIHVWNKTEIIQTEKFKVSEKKFNFTSIEYPHSLELIIQDGEKEIYKSKHGFLRSINIQASIVTGSVQLGNGKSKDVIHSSKFSVD